MTKEYQDLQHLDHEEPGRHQPRRGSPPPKKSLCQRFCSGPCLLLLSLSLSIVLLVVVSVIGSQNAQLQRELKALRETFDNFTVSTAARVKALSTEGGSVGKKMQLLESQLEKQQQDLSGEHSSLLFHVKQFVFNLRSLSCQMAVLQSNGSQSSCCPVNWMEFQGSCYWFSKSGKPWPEADRYCQLENAHLVVITSWDKQRFVQHHMGSVQTWIGLTDQSGSWNWVDGTDYETGFKNWAPLQPDNWYGHGLGGGEDCAHITPDGRWNDDVCQRPYRWVCETELNKTSTRPPSP